MASLTQWTWVWVNSGSWWWTGRPGVLRFMGSQRVGHDWATDLIWYDLRQNRKGRGKRKKSESLQHLEDWGTNDRDRWVLIHRLTLVSHSSRKWRAPRTLPGWLNGKESACNAGDLDLIPGFWRSSEGQGYPHQYPCLGNPVDRRAWWFTVHGVTKDQTWLSDQHFHFLFDYDCLCLSLNNIRPYDWSQKSLFSVSQYKV